MMSCGRVVDNSPRGGAVLSITDVLESGRDELTPEETREMLEERTMAVYGLTLDDFVNEAEADTLPAHPELVHLVLLSGARTNSC